MRISTLKTAAVLLCMGATAGAAAQIMAPAQITPDMVVTRHFSPQTAEEFVPVNTEYLVNTDAFGMARTSTRETGAEFQFALQPGANYAILFKCLSTAEEVTIPDGTVKIAPYALSNSTKVKKINLPESLKEIGNFAFRSCNLQDITLGKNLTTLGYGVFQGNASFNAINLDAANTAFTVSNGMLVHKASKTLVAVTANTKELSVPAGVETIAPYLLYANKNITKLDAPQSTKTVGEYAFYNCPSLAQVQLPGAVTLESSSFWHAVKLQSINFPSSLRTIGPYSFCGSGLKEAIIPEGVDSIGGAAFQRCDSLLKASTPSTATKMGDVMFFECAVLGEINVAEGVTYIPDNMAYGCTKLYFFTFPKSLKRIGKGAFSFSWLQEANLWEGLEKVGSSAFQLCPLKNINVPNTVVEIDDFGFSLTNATYIKCGKGLKRLGNLAFQGNKRAATIELNEGLQEIGFKALYSEQLISDFVIPASVTTIGDSALIMTPLRKLTNRSSVPQAIATSIIGMPVKLDWNPTPHELYDSCELCVPESALEAYKAAPVWRQFKKITGFAGVNNIDDENAEIVKIYSIEGYRRDRLMPGINICRYSNGKTRKVFSR